MKIIFGIIVLLALSLLGYLGTELLGSSQEGAAATGSNVKMEGDTQVVEITAKGGYVPRVSTVKAGIPTVIRFNTKGTFDCSSSVRIPSLDVSRQLPASGVTDIAVGTLAAGVLQGTCGMGMYPFQLNIQG